MWQPGRPFKFFNAAGLVEVKGHEDLLRAFASAFAGDEKVSLRIAGGGSLRDDLEVLVAQQGIGKQVYFLGEISRGDVVEEMLSCDAYVQSSHYETFGLAIIEAFACGKPVVTTCTEGARQFVNEQNGMTVPVKDIPALAGALSWMRSNAGRYDSHSIRELCLLQFGEKAIVNRLTSIYNGVISSSRESSPIR